MGKGVEIDSVLTVVSSTPVKPGRACQLSPLDRAFGQHSLHVIFYYRSEPGSMNLDRIRPTLNQVLSLYPNVTGRLARDGDGNWEVRCTDAGVRAFTAKVGMSLDEWLRSASLDDELDLTARDDLPDDPHIWSPYRIQITEFEGGGTAISLSCPHMLADPMSATLLIKSWSETCHREAIAHPPFISPLSLAPPANTVASPPPYYAAKSNVSNPDQQLPRMASATFDFSHLMISQHLSEIQSDVPDASPFDLLTALFWTRIMLVKNKLLDDLTEARSISICIDMRKRLSAPLPYGYFGNALHFSLLTLDDSKVDRGSLRQVAGLVHWHVAGVKEAEFWSAVDWLKSRKDVEGKFAPPSRMYGLELTCVNMEHMIAPIGPHRDESHPLMYMTMFEKDQRPAHVSYHIGNAEGEGLILVMPSPDEGLARRVAVTLPREEMEKLLEDKVILSLEPTLLLNGRK